MESREPRIAKVLLVGQSPQGSSCLAKRLQARGCECEFAISYRQACSLLVSRDFDLVLSPIRLRDGSLFPLIRLLDGSGSTLFYSHAVEEGCWWLPALRRGLNCFGSPALNPREFAAALDKVIEEIRVPESAEMENLQFVALGLPNPLAMLPLSRESSPAETKRVQKSRVVAA